MKYWFLVLIVWHVNYSNAGDLCPSCCNPESDPKRVAFVTRAAAIMVGQGQDLELEEPYTQLYDPEEDDVQEHADKAKQRKISAAWIAEYAPGQRVTPALQQQAEQEAEVYLQDAEWGCGSGCIIL